MRRWVGLVLGSLGSLVWFGAPLLAQDTAPEAAAAGPTYYKDVAPIVQERCQVCHREGAIGPFPLLTYRDVLGNSAMIEEVVENRRMPPWHASKDSGPFSNKRALPDHERQTILDWIKGGAPAGDAADAPPAVGWPDPKGWKIGEPDLVLKTPEAFPVPANGVVQYQYWTVPTGLTEDTWVTSWEVKVEAPDVVHHVLVFVVYPDGRRSPNVKGGLKGYFCSMLPGESLEPFPLGSAKLLPAGSKLRFQVHYTTNGEAVTDRISLGLKFAKAKDSPRRARTVALSTVRFLIPPGAKDFPVRARYTFDRDTMLMGLTPHMHLRGQTFSYLLIRPDGSSKRLLYIPKWDFNWQANYRFKEPLFVPRGSKMVGVATYDNSKGNRANPDPEALVRFGEQTWHEMMIGYMDTVDATPEERKAWETQPAEPKKKKVEFFK